MITLGYHINHMKKLLIALTLLLSTALFAQTNGTISCSNGPLRTTETYSPFANTDDGLGRLQLTINCTMTVNTGATGYLSASFSSGTVTIAHPADVTFTDGFIVVGNGNKAGWTFDLEVTKPDGTNKHFKMNYMSGIPAPNNQHDQSWPLVLSLPAGSTFKADIYAYADDVSWCSSTCYASSQWNLQ